MMNNPDEINPVSHALYVNRTPDFWSCLGVYLRSLRASLPKGEVLIAGSGGSEFSVLARHYGYNTLNLDIDPTVEPDIVHDLKNPLPFADHRFDAVCAHHVLEHLPFSFARSVFAEAARVLKPGGYFFLSLPYRAWNMTAMLRCCRWEWALHPKRILKRFTPHGCHYWEVDRVHPRKELLKLLRDAGFTTCTPVETFYNPFEFFVIAQP